MLRFTIAIDPSEVPHLLRQHESGVFQRAIRVFRTAHTAKENKRIWRQPNVRLWELTYDPADGSANALKITAEVE